MKIAIRNIKKDKLYFSINVLGLALGIVCSLLILVYIQDELSFDRHFKNNDNIYRLTQNFLYDQSHFARCAPAFGPLLHEYFPEIKEIVRLNLQTKVISIKNCRYKFFQCF
jgi:putative ABC transport system permease protein